MKSARFLRAIFYFLLLILIKLNSQSNSHSPLNYRKSIIKRILQANKRYYRIIFAKDLQKTLFISNFHFQPFDPYRPVDCFHLIAQNRIAFFCIFKFFPFFKLFSFYLVFFTEIHLNFWLNIHVVRLKVDNLGARNGFPLHTAKFDWKSTFKFIQMPTFQEFTKVGEVKLLSCSLKAHTFSVQPSNASLISPLSEPFVPRMPLNINSPVNVVEAFRT